MSSRNLCLFVYLYDILIVADLTNICLCLLKEHLTRVEGTSSTRFQITGKHFNG